MRGLAWRMKLPDEMIGKLSINLLEFLASVITIYLTLQEIIGPQKILAYTDSSSALGWLYKASFSETQPMHDEVARWLASILMEHDSALYSQHIRGIQNFIADSLSRDHHLSNKQLTLLFKTLLPSQTPQNFVISPLPKEISSWVLSLSRLSTKMQGLLPPPTKSKAGALIDGEDSLEVLGLKMSGWENIVKNNDATLSPHLRGLVDEIVRARQRKLSSRDLQLSPPSRMYARPFGRIYGQTRP